MTLRKSKLEENMPKMDDEILRDNLKISAFRDTLTEIGHYLSRKEPIVTNARPRDDNTILYGVPITLVGNNCKENPYLTAFRDIFEKAYYFKAEYIDTPPFKHRIVSSNWWTCFDDKDYYEFDKLENIFIQFSRGYSGREFEKREGYWVGYTHLGFCEGLSVSFLKLYITFWNLFLCSLDDDIYNEQLPLVIELAHCFNLDEHIMRDLCRGVEYVLSGKKLSPDCDLQCDTVECAKFFLGKEE